MKKVISLPSSPAALRRFSPSSHSPSSSTRSSSTHNNKTTSPALRRPSPNSHHHHKPNNKKSANKKKLSLSIKLAASSDSEWGRTDDEGDDDDSTTWGSSDEDEWESSFDPLWVVDADELELHRRWTDQNGITTAGQPAGVIKGKPLRRSPLATNSTVSTSLSLPASEHHPTAQHLDVGAGACADVSTSRPPSPSTTATATGHQISYAQLQSAANAASSAAARHSPSSSPRKPVDVPAGSLLPALDLDRVVSSPVSLGSSMSRRNTIATPREARGDASSSAAAGVSQWKVGKISPRGGDDVKSEATAAQKNESEEATAAKLSPRRSELQISFERFEARLALKKQQSEVIGVKTPESNEQPQPQRDQGTTANSKRSGSKRKMKKNVRSLNKEETDAKRKKKRSEAETRRTYRRSQGSPPMLLRSAAAAVESDSDSSEVAGYLAECGGSETESEEERRAKASSAPVSPHSSSSSSMSSLAVIASLALRSGGGFPLNRSRSSEVQAKARRTISKEDKKRDDANNVGAGAISTDHLPVIATATPLPPNNNINSSSVNKASSNHTHDSSATDNAELTWKTIWQDPHEGETEGAVTLTSSSSSSTPPLTSSLSANEASTRKALKRGLEGRSASLPPVPSRPPLAPPSSPSLPPHIEPLPFPPFATSPPASLNPLASPPAPAPSSSVASPSLRHRCRAESSGAPQQLMLVAPPLLPHVYQKQQQQQLLHHHPHRSLERVRTVVLSPSLATRQPLRLQQQRQAGLSVVSLGCSSRAAAESGEINTSSFLRSQSEEISARSFDDDFDNGDDDSGGVDQVDDGLHERRQVTSWRGRSGGEWRNRSRESGFHHQSDDLATRRARIERARSFGGAKADADHCDSGDDDDDLLLFVSDDDDDSVFVDDEVDGGEEEEHLIEAELTSFLKRTRSGSHKPLRDFSGSLEGRRSPLTVRLVPHHHHHHHHPHAPMTPTTRDEGGDELTITDGGLESGESHTAGGASRDSGHELPCRSPWGITLE